MDKRRCHCPHPYPVCACADGVTGPELLRRSKWLSSLTGWPNPPATAPADAGDPKRIRAGIIAPGCYRGGAEMWMLNLLDLVDPARVQWREIGILYPEHTDVWMRGEMARRGPIGQGWEALDSVYRSCDVVLLWGVAAHDQRIPPRPRDCSVVLVSHGSGPWTARVFERYDLADATAAVSTIALDPVPAEIRAITPVIPNCFLPNRVQPTAGARGRLRRQWGARPGEFVLGYLGRLSAEKNPAALIAAVAASPNLRGVYVGDGALREDLEAAVAASPARDRIVFNGMVERPGDALSAFDAMLLPSHEEGCAIVILEAWAAGTPVIATPVGVAPEWPECVRLVPLRPTGQQIAEAVAADLADVAGTGERILRAQAVAHDWFSPETFGRKWTALIEASAPASARARVARARKPRIPLGVKQCLTCP